MPDSKYASEKVIFIVATTASLCLLILVCVAAWMLTHGEDVSSLGTLQKAGTGTGILALAGLIVQVIQSILGRGETSKQSNPIGTKRPMLLLAFSYVLPVAASFGSAYIASGLEVQMEQKKLLERQVQDLSKTRQGILSFLGEFSKREKIPLIKDNVDWSRVVAAIDSLPEGQRKHAVYGAILGAWAEFPFKLGGNQISSGVNSPEFLRRILAGSGLVIKPRPKELTSSALIRESKEVKIPIPGDLMFYVGADSGSTGKFVMMYLAGGDSCGHGVCLGSYDSKNPVQIRDAVYFDRVKPIDRFVGYYRPPYRP